MTDSNGTSYWLVGAHDDNLNLDLTEEHLKKGIWKNYYNNRYLDVVKSMKPGDKIGIKSTYTKKTGMSFDSKGQTVSVMAIKAIGTVIENLGDGQNIKVDWEKDFQKKEWYFYTYRKTIWKVNSMKEFGRDLIGFAFNGKDQDISKYRNDPYWVKRFGDEFSWTAFYIEFATALLQYRDNRKGLLSIIEKVSKDVDILKVHQDVYANGKSGPLRDICPFTFLALFNRGLTPKNRNAIAEGFRLEMGVSTPAPSEFRGIPTLMNQAAWFFSYEKNRGAQDIDTLWDLFATAIEYADSDEVDQQDLVKRFDAALEVTGVKWNITMGLYWIRPWDFVTLDRNTREFIVGQLGIDIPVSAINSMATGGEYVELNQILSDQFEEESFPVHSFPELSLKAWMGEEVETDGAPTWRSTGTTSSTQREYGLKEILSDGGFMSSEFLQETLIALEVKKNIILQGPPGTGKSWLAKRLAYALRGDTSNSGVVSMQFHANMSYEDFIRGWRPNGKGELVLTDGPFMELIEKARTNPAEKFVFVIEEINRGNPAQIFGEMLTLLENDKRKMGDSLQLTYRIDPEERVFVPENLYVIGTMNTADKSLAILDFAFRRRFAFTTLEPLFNHSWRDWLRTNFNIPMNKSAKLQAAIENLNRTIRDDQNLGSSYEIGHSYFTPTTSKETEDFGLWIQRIVTNEIGPTLFEYWYDNPNKASEAIELIMRDLN